MQLRFTGEVVAVAAQQRGPDRGAFLIAQWHRVRHWPRRQAQFESCGAQCPRHCPNTKSPGGTQAAAAAMKKSATG